MKRGIIQLVLLSIFICKAWSFENIKFKLIPEIGIMNGNIYEYVFSNACHNTDNILSKLDWEVKNVPYLELTARTDIYKYVFVSADFKAAIPCTSGKMQDYDWLNSLGGSGDIPLSWKNDPATELTNYSSSQNKMIDYFDFNLAFGGNILLAKKYVISPFLGWNYKFLTFDAIGGFTDYKSNNHVKKVIEGRVISYKQEQNAFMLGINFDAQFTKKIHAFAQLMVCPGLGTFTSVDYHYMNVTDSSGTAYLDKLDSYFELKAKLMANYEFTKYANFGLSLAIDYLPLKKGPDYSRSIDKDGNFLYEYSTWSKTSILGGSDALIWSFAITYNLSF